MFVCVCVSESKVQTENIATLIHSRVVAYHLNNELYRELKVII